MKDSYRNVVFVLSLIAALWFAVAGVVWVYYAALFIAYPVGLLSLLLWRWGKRSDPRSRRYVYVLYLLVAGLVFSIGSLVAQLVAG